jgi:hypothetical protein
LTKRDHWWHRDNELGLVGPGGGAEVKANVTRIVILTIAVMLAGTAAWGKKFALVMSPSVPAAKGTAETSADRNGNTELTVKVENLALPTALKHPAATYVIWIQQAGQQPTNAGKMDVGGNLKGEFKTSTPLKTFEIFATAENNPLTQTPSGERIFHATVQQ